MNIKYQVSLLQHLVINFSHFLTQFWVTTNVDRKYSLKRHYTSWKTKNKLYNLTKVLKVYIFYSYFRKLCTHISGTGILSLFNIPHNYRFYKSPFIKYMSFFCLLAYDEFLVQVVAYFFPWSCLPYLSFSAFSKLHFHLLTF